MFLKLLRQAVILIKSCFDLLPHHHLHLHLLLLLTGSLEHFPVVACDESDDDNDDTQV